MDEAALPEGWRFVVRREPENYRIQFEAQPPEGQDSDPIIERITLDDAEREDVLNMTLDRLASKAQAREDARAQQQGKAQALEARFERVEQMARARVRVTTRQRATTSQGTVDRVVRRARRTI